MTKYIILVGDGMADLPLEELDGRTPLEAAKTPNMDFLAAGGMTGLVQTIPQGMSPASDVANLSLLGYDPKVYYSGRGPLEAANMGIDLSEDEVAFRCNLITAEKDILEDYSAGHITSKESKILLQYLDEQLGTEDIKFYPGVSYRHLVVIKAKDEQQLKDLISTETVPPHNILGQKISQNMPKGKGEKLLVRLMKESRKILEEHEANKVRIDLKENPANMIWLWGQGTKPNMPAFMDKYGMTGSIISAVDLVNGIGRIAGLKPIKVPGATGYYDTDYEAKAQYGIESLEERDFVFVHVEAPDEAGHNGDLREKIRAIENFDKLVVGKFIEAFRGKTDFRMMVLPDHPTPISLRTHTADPVPFVMYGKEIAADESAGFTESAAESSKRFYKSGHELVDAFMA